MRGNWLNCEVTKTGKQCQRDREQGIAQKASELREVTTSASIVEGHLEGLTLQITNDKYKSSCSWTYEKSRTRKLTHKHVAKI